MYVVFSYLHQNRIYTFVFSSLKALPHPVKLVQVAPLLCRYIRGLQGKVFSDANYMRGKVGDPRPDER